MNRFIQIQGYLWLVIEYSFFGQSVLLYEEMRVQSISGTLFLLMLFCFTHYGKVFLTWISKEDAPHTKVLCTAQDTKGKEDLDKSHNKSTLHFDSQRYVQDLLREEFPNICEQILDNDAHVYVCGAAAMAEGVNNTLQVLFCIGFMVVSESPDTLHFISKHFSTFRGGIHSPRKSLLKNRKRRREGRLLFHQTISFFHSYLRLLDLRKHPFLPAAKSEEKRMFSQTSDC